MKKIVITGGPCSGKTSVIKGLKNKGYYVIPEAAMYLIEKEDKAKGDIFPWTNFKEFNRRVIQLQQEWEAKIPKTVEIVIQDRSLIDIAAYFKSQKLEVPKNLAKLISQAKYDKVFFLEMLPEIYWTQTKSGRPRMQTYKQGQQIHKIIRSVYKFYNIPLLDISFSPISTRIELIKKQL